MPSTRWVPSLIALAAASIACPTTAAPTEQEQAIAKDLFDKGVKLVDEFKCDEAPIDLKKCREARDAFKRAYELTGALGALRNLAYVEKGLGLVASASRSFRDLARQAPNDPKPERRKWAGFARDEADKLEPRIPTLVVKVVETAPGTKITLDGAPLPEAAWNTPVPIDPGKHAVHAEAPGRLSFEGSATLDERQQKTIAVVLDADVKAVETARGGSKVGPIVVTTVGVVGVGAGLGLGYLSMKQRDDACDANKLCDPQGLSDGRRLADLSTLVAGAGAAVAVAGVVWWVASPSSAASATKAGDRGSIVVPWASTTGGGLAALGRF